MTTRQRKTRFITPNKKAGVRQETSSFRAAPVYLEALRRTVHRDEKSGKLVSQGAIITTALLKIPEFREKVREVKQEKGDALNEGRINRSKPDEHHAAQ